MCSKSRHVVYIQSHSTPRGDSVECAHDISPCFLFYNATDRRLPRPYTCSPGGGYDVTYLTNSGSLCRSGARRAHLELSGFGWSPSRAFPLTVLRHGRDESDRYRPLSSHPQDRRRLRRSTDAVSPSPPFETCQATQVRGLRGDDVSLGASAPYGGPGAPPPPLGGAARAGGGGTAALW